MAYISVSLSVNDPQPGNYQITIQDCNGGSSVTVATGLTNPNDFPYTFNTDDFINYGDCFNYTILDTLSGCESTGTFRDGGTVTPLPTQPTPTPVPDEDEVTIKVDLSGGSTKLTFTATSTKTATQNTDVVFDYVLYKLDGSTKTVPVNMTILSGQREVSKEIVLKDDFATVDTRQHLIKNESTTDSNLKVVKYGEKTIEGEKISLVHFDFVSCCDNNDIITASVDSRSLEDGWVSKGGIIYYNRKCYSPLKVSKNIKSVGVFYGPDYSSCRVAPCFPCVASTPTPTPSAEVPSLGKSYTYLSLIDEEGVILNANVKNKDLEKGAFSYNNKCFTIHTDNNEYIIGVNDVREPVIKSDKTYNTLTACKLDNKLPLSTIIEYAEVSYPLSTTKKNYLILPPDVNEDDLTTYLNAFTECGEGAKNPDIFVWYDNSGSYDNAELFEASASIRKWYTSLIESNIGGDDNGDGTIVGTWSGRLFEAAFQQSSDTGAENPISLSTYNTLGSLTGGTINGEELSYGEWRNRNRLSFNEDDRFTKMSLGLPYGDSTDVYSGTVFSGSPHPWIVQAAIDSGLSVNILENPISITNSQRKSWAQNSNKYANITSETALQYGQTDFLDSITIIISNEFTEGIPNAEVSSEIISPPSMNSTQMDRWKISMNIYFKVFQYRKEMGYNTQNILFSFPKINLAVAGSITVGTSPSYIYHMLSLAEGDGFSLVEGSDGPSWDYFESLSSVDVNNNEVTITKPYLNPYLYDQPSGNPKNFTGLTQNAESLFGWIYTDPYVDFSNTVSAEYQSGVGLKNYGFRVDPSLSSFNFNVVNNRLISFVNEQLLGALSTYTLVECNNGSNDCLNYGQIVYVGGQQYCQQVVQNNTVYESESLTGYTGTGTFVVDPNDYPNIITTYSNSNILLLDDCDCVCDNESLDFNNRHSITFTNSGSTSVDVTVHGSYESGGSIIPTTYTITVNASEEITVSGEDFVDASCIDLSTTLENFPSNITNVSYGECCDPSDPIVPSMTPTATATQTPTATSTSTPTPTATSTQTPTPSLSFSPTPPPSLSSTPTPTPTPTATSTPTHTPTSSQTPTPSISPGESATPTPTPSASPIPCVDLSLSSAQTQPSGNGCELDDIVLINTIVGNYGGGQLQLLGLSANTSGDPVVLTSGTDFTVSYPTEGQVNITLPWETYQNVNYNSFHVCIITPTGCEVCDDVTINGCPCDEYHIFCDCVVGAVYSNTINPYNGDTSDYEWNGTVYKVPLTIDSICDLLPLAVITYDSENNPIYTVSIEAITAAFNAHLFWQNDLNTNQDDISSSWFDVNNDGVISAADLLIITSDIFVSDVFILNDYLECFDSDLDCIYYEHNGQDYIEGEYYYLELVGGYTSCFRYDGVLQDCMGNVEHFGTISSSSASYTGCTECTNDNYPTPTATSTPTPTPTASKTNCQINLTTLGNVVTDTDPVFNVNAINVYFPRIQDVSFEEKYVDGEGGYDDFIPKYVNEYQPEGSTTPINNQIITEVLPSICTYFKSVNMWPTTLENGGQVLNGELWNDVRINNITQPIYINCQSDCLETTYLTDSNSLPLTWGEFKTNYLQVEWDPTDENSISLGDRFTQELPLYVYDENKDIIYSIATIAIHEQIKTQTAVTPPNDDDLLVVDEVSNCESNNDIFVTDDGNGGWTFNGVSGNPKLSLKVGNTYRFHVHSTKDFWLGFSNNENTELIDINSNDPCADPLLVEVSNDQSLLVTYDNLQDGWCTSSTIATESNCGEILHEKISDYDLGNPYYNKTVIFRPSCDFDCSLQLYYYDKLQVYDVNADHSTHLGYILINKETECSSGVTIIHPGYLNGENGLIPELTVTWVDCEGNNHTTTIYHPGITNPQEGIQPYEYEIPGCINPNSVSILPVYVDIDSVKPQRGKCWCGSTITKGQNCWDACGVKKPNFNRYDKKTPVYTEKDGVKIIENTEMRRLISNQPYIFGSIGSVGTCCTNCNIDGVEVIDYKYWLAQNCCDPTDVIITRVFTDPQKGQGFSLVDRVNPPNILGEYDILCYKFTNEILIGCDFNTIRAISVSPSQYISQDPCENTAPDYDTAIQNGLCLPCQTEPDPLPCNLPYRKHSPNGPDGQLHTIEGITGSFNQFVLDFGEGTGDIEMIFNSYNTSNRIQVYTILSNDSSEYMNTTGVNNYSGLVLKADSLWVGKNLTYYTGNTSESLSIFNQELGNITDQTLNGINTWFYTGDCSNTWDSNNHIPLDNYSDLWNLSPNAVVEYPNPSVDGTVPMSHIPVGTGGNTIYRSEGFTGQVGVVNNYPSSSALACDNRVKLKFSKGYNKRLYLVRVWDYKDATGSNDPWTLDVSCINPCSTEVIHNWTSINPCDGSNIQCGGRTVTNTHPTDNLVFSYNGCPSSTLENVTLTPGQTTSFCHVQGSISVTSGTGNFVVNNDVCPFITADLDNNFSVYNIDNTGGQYGIPESDTNNIRLVYTDSFFDLSNMWTLASVSDYNYNSFFTAPITGYYSFTAKHDIRLSNAANTNVVIRPKLVDIDTNQVLATGPLVNILWGVGYLSSYYHNWTFDDVLIYEGQKVRHEFDKVLTISNVQGDDVDPYQTLYIYDVGTVFACVNFELLTNPTTLFIDSDTPNIPQPCDYAYLDPCCTVPASGYMVVDLPNGNIIEYVINENGLIDYCPCCDSTNEYGDNQICSHIEQVLVNPPTSVNEYPLNICPIFIPNTLNSSGTNNTWGPVYDCQDCISWTLYLSPYCDQLDSYTGVVHTMTTGDVWDGQFISNVDGELTGPYQCVFGYRFVWETSNGLSGEYFSDVTVLV